MTSKRKYDKHDVPYGEIRYPHKPKSYSSKRGKHLSTPETNEEQIYCWFYWVNLILDPLTTRSVLDSLDYIPEFEASWGQDWYKGDRIFLKNVKTIVKPMKEGEKTSPKPKHL